MRAALWLLVAAFFVDLALCQLPTYHNTGMDNVVFQHSLLFDRPVRSLLECATRCSQDDKCVTFTRVVQTSGHVTCRCHSAEMGPASPQTSSGQAKAKTYVMTNAKEKTVDPCAPEGHTTLDNEDRDVDDVGLANVGDDNLTAGWYRFKLNGTNAVIPTTCPDTNRCSATYPGWLNLEGSTLPSTPGQELETTACGGYTPTCCTYRLSVKVRNCDSHFVYYLVPTASMDMNYCAEPAL